MRWHVRREHEAFDRSIDVQISRLRKLIEDDPAKPRYIQTCGASATCSCRMGHRAMKLWPQNLAVGDGAGSRC